MRRAPGIARLAASCILASLSFVGIAANGTAIHSSGPLVMGTNGITALTIDASQNVTLAVPLAAASVGDLPASKLTTGQLAAARGGTGLDGGAAPNGALPIGNGNGFTLALPTVETGSGLAVVPGAGSVQFGTAGPSAQGLGLLYVLKATMTAVAINADAVIYNANAPFAFTVLDSLVITTTGVTSGAVTLRTATGGGGSAASSAMLAVVAGLSRNAQTTAPVSVPLNGTLVARHSAGAGNVTATVIVYVQRN